MVSEFLNWFYKMKKNQEKMEKKIIEEELSLLLEVTLRLEDELNSVLAR